MKHQLKILIAIAILFNVVWVIILINQPKHIKTEPTIIKYSEPKEVKDLPDTTKVKFLIRYFNDSDKVGMNKAELIDAIASGSKLTKADAG